MMRKDIVVLIFFVSVYIVSATSTTKKDMYTNILKSRSNDIQNYPLNNNNPPEYKLTDVANRHVDNIRNKNRQINLKMAQRPNNQQNGDFSKLAENLRRYKVNVTAAKQDGPEISAPNMIPIFRPLLNNIRNVHPKELIKINENTSNTNLKSNFLDNNEEVLDLIGNETENDMSNYPTNDIETISLLKQQYAQDFQQTISEINPIGIRIGEEYFEITNVNDKEEKVLELTDILSPNSVISSAQTTSLIGDHIKTIDTSKGNIQPQFKGNSLNQNTQNLFTLSENLNPSTDDLNTIQNVITHNHGLPNNMIIKSLRFVPLSEMQNQVVPNTVAQNLIPQTAQQDPCETFIERPLLEENNAIYRTDNYRMNPATSNTRFDIPCFTATDILEDLGSYSQNKVQPIMYPMSESIGTNLACNIESGNDVEEESLAIIFKPKNISLLKVYGDILKKITLTVLVPYHVSKLIT